MFKALEWFKLQTAGQKERSAGRFGAAGRSPCEASETVVVSQPERSEGVMSRRKIE
jgi:hypothetical protein